MTSMFLHGSRMHLVGSVWFLWIFVSNVEDSMGHLRFGAFYVLTGLVATLAHVASEPASAVPVVGASRAISAIIGAYQAKRAQIRLPRNEIPNRGWW